MRPVTHPEPDSVLSAARTFLFVPADQERKRTKAWTAGADVVILDLEDGVAPNSKAAARADLAEALAARPRGGPLAAVRINGLDSHEGSRDLAALEGLVVDAIVVPKADPATLAALAPAPPVIALVETAAGVLHAEAVARAARVERLMFGQVDLTGELGCEPGSQGDELLLARSQIVLASAAARIAAPIDGPSVAIGDQSALEAETERARRLGFTAKACIHPGQIEPVARALAPTPEQVAWARRVVDAYDQAIAADSGVIAVDGRMVDVPVARRARAILQQHAS